MFQPHTPWFQFVESLCSLASTCSGAPAQMGLSRMLHIIIDGNFTRKITLDDRPWGLGALDFQTKAIINMFEANDQ